MFRRLNDWFNALPEPKRTLYFFGGAFTMFGLMWFPPTAPVGGILFVFAMVWGITRL